jgi:pimeloyl-ACP methyl ester carboxylesterase
MGSDAGFVNDLRQGRSSGAKGRLDALSKIRCPTLVTGSRHDRGVRFAYAQDLADVIPGAVLVELDSLSHIFWIGPGRAHLTSIVQPFID